MSKWILALLVAIAGVTLAINEAEAKKLGGGRSIGAQRNVAPPASVPARPGQQAAPGSQQAAPAAAAQPAASGMSRWLPMLGGLAIGGLLGSMLGGFGGFGGILMIALLAIGAVLVFKAFARRREEAAPSRPVQLAGMGNEKISMPQPTGSEKVGAAFDTRTQNPANVPAGFDTASFLRGAKLNFVKLQVANDAGNMDEIREFTTAEMFSELNKDVQARTSAPEQTDVVGLEADLLQIATESGKHWASVRFSGTMRETRDSAPVDFEEVWNLVKPADGSSGWLLAGIQQMH
jgi:predicted lipid-binding transport protein (Tim44 family)